MDWVFAASTAVLPTEVHVRGKESQAGLKLQDKRIVFCEDGDSVVVFAISLFGKIIFETLCKCHRS